MARVTLSKSSLSRESAQLKTFERYLPSLDLKRRQLIAERAKALRQFRAIQDEASTVSQRVARELPMLATGRVQLQGLARVTGVALGKENLVGTELPVLGGVQVELARYPLLGKPHWVDKLEELLKQVLEQRIRAQVLEERLRLLDEAVRIITQRVNLFEKVLIPRTRENIRKIRIYLADAERAAVVRAKIAKRKRAAEA
jgi:V/A-type H+-transporting ATPase subunit D